MPWSRPYSRGVHIASAAAQIQHGQVVQEAGFVGVAIKQQAYTIATARSAVATIAVGESYFLATRGEVEMPFLTSCVVGDEVCITTADNTLHRGAPGGGQVKVGRVVRVPGSGGMPSAASATGVTPVIPAGGLMAVNLDDKDSL